MDIEDLFSDDGVPEPGGAAATVAPAREPAGPPAGSSGRARYLWYVEEQIRTLRTGLAKAQAEDNLVRQSSLSGQLLKWLEVLKELSPVEPEKPEDEDARWKADADHATDKIERGVAKAQERMAAQLGAPFRSRYLELVRPAAGVAGGRSEGDPRDADAA